MPNVRSTQKDMKLESADGCQVTCRVVGPSAEFVGKQALFYAPGISAESVGAQAIHLQVVTIPAGGRGKAHRHDGHETGIYILSGESGMWYGERLEEHLSAKRGDFVYMPADMPHLPTIEAIRKAALRSLLALILTSKKASYCYLSLIASAHRPNASPMTLGLSRVMYLYH
jgi:uncharacterized RmlC-like cupin family protein